MQKTAVVVGGANGVGGGLARAMGSHGYRVIVGDRQPPASDLHYIPLEASDPASVEVFRARLNAAATTIDALAITIGAIDEGSVIGQTDERWRWMLEANIVSVARVVDALVPDMLRSGAGRILLTGSGSGLTTPTPRPGLGLYAICKHGLTGYFRALREELRETGLSVSLLLPSGIEGRLAETSASARCKVLNEAYAPERGRQPPGRRLYDADSAGRDFVEQWLDGRPVISNAPEAVSASVQAEASWLMQALLEGQSSTGSTSDGPG